MYYMRTSSSFKPEGQDWHEKQTLRFSNDIGKLFSFLFYLKCQSDRKEVFNRYQ